MYIVNQIVVCVKMLLKRSKEALAVLIVTHVIVLMSKGSKVVFVAYVLNIDTFNAMSKASKKALTVLIVTHVTHVKRVKSGVCGFVHNTDTFSAMSKVSKDYVMLKQGTNMFFLITFLIFKRFSI